MRKLLVLLILSLLPFAAHADAVLIDGLWYNLYPASDEGMTAAYAEVINSQGSIYTGEILIPESVTYNDATAGNVTYPVTAIADNAFSGSDITKVEIPSCITSIGDYAFAHCQNLYAVVSRITSPYAIEDGVFETGAYSENSVTVYTPSGAVLYVPTGTTSLYQALEGWTNVLAIEEGDVLIGTAGDLKYACATGSMVATVISDDSYSILENVNIPASVTINGGSYAVKYVGPNAFFERSNISSVTLNDGLKAIGNGAFRYCYNAKFSELPSSLISIGEWAFYNCNSINKLIVPNTCKSIGVYAFHACGGLKRIELPSSLSSIGYHAFGNCQSLSVVVSYILSPFEIGQTVFASSYEGSYNNAGEWVVTYTPTSANLYVPVGTKSSYQAIAGWNMFADIIEGELKEGTYDGLNYSYLVDSEDAILVAGDYLSLTDVTIPQSVVFDGESYVVKSVGAGAFRNCYNLQTVTFSEGLETIGEEAFYYCSSVNFSSLPSTIKSIGDLAFINCNALTKLDIPNGCTTIGESAFKDCASLQSIKLPSSITSIGEYAFRGLYNLQKVISKISTPFGISEGVFCKNCDSVNGEMEYTATGATLYVPTGLKPKYQSTNGWKSFPEILEGDPKEGAYDGLNYSYLEGGGTATVISGDYSELTEVNIPATVSFDNVTYSVKKIGESAFSNLDNIKTVTIANGVEEIGNQAFWDCDGLTNLTLPSSSLRKIGDEAFTWMRMKTLELPEGLESIGAHAFGSNGNLQRVVLPSTLSALGDGIFNSCSSLTTVVSHITDPFVIKESVFGNGNGSQWDESQQQYVTVYEPSKANLYVPEGTKSKYQAISGWTMFAEIYEGELMETVIDGLKYNYMTGSHEAILVAGDYSDMRKVEIPSSVPIDGESYRVREIGAGAFSNCSRLDTVIINYGVEVIGKNAFSYCYNAEFGSLPSSLVTISDNAFYNCNKFKILEIPASVTTIGKMAFTYCNGLEKVILPNSLGSIDEYAFAACNKLTMVVSRIETPFAINKDVFCSSWEWNGNEQVLGTCGATLSVPMGTLSKYQALEGWMMFADYVEGELVEETIDGLTYVINKSSKNASLTRGDNYSGKITVPSTILYEGESYRVKGVAARAFRETSVSSVILESGIESIGQEAFGNCQQLVNVSLPPTLTTIDAHAFLSCHRLTSIVIPASVNTLGNCIFSDCANLSSLEVEEGNKTYESRGANAIIESKTNTLLYGCKNTIIPTSVTAIGYEAFFGSNIESIQIPGSVKTIGNNSFNCCRYLKEVILPEGLETLEGWAFGNCERLETIEFPASLTEIGPCIVNACTQLTNVVANSENPEEISDDVFADNANIYERVTLWVPKGKIDNYKRVNGWKNFKNFDEMLGDILTKPTITYNGRYMVMTNDASQKAKIYYSLDDTAPTILYSDTIAISNLGTIQAISKRFGSFTVDTTVYKIDYLFDGVTARTANGGLLKNAFEWCGTDKVEALDIDGTLNDDDFGTIRSLSKIKTLNMAATKLANGTIPAEAFANTKLQWFVSPYTMTDVGTNIFKGCDMLSAITWNSSTIELPEDVVTDVGNPNMIVYAKALAMIPYALRNVVINGVANVITLVDSTGNNNFVCPEPFLARRISYTHDYQQPTVIGKTQGWETLALPFTVGTITHEKQGEITPMSVDGAKKPFWLYELGDNGLVATSEIKANVPYLICMPNDDAYGDEYILGGRVTFSAKNATITTSGGIAVSNGDRQFVPTYKRVASSADVFVLNVNQVVGDNPVGSAFVSSLRDVRPFEAYSVHSSNKARVISVTSLGGGDATGISDLMLKKDGETANDVVKVYSLSGALIMQGKREEVLHGLPKGLYIIDGKKIIK